MDILKQCAISFESLMQTQYHFLAGSKQTLIDFTLYFAKEHFMHLNGLHKLTDIQQLQRQRKDKIPDMILNDEITYELIQKSSFFSEIENRLLLFPLLENALDNNELIIKYKQGFTPGTRISAQYILIYQHSDTLLHLFIDRADDSNIFCGKSFFGRTDTKYTKGQQTFKILQKTKINLSTNTSILLIDKLKQKEPYPLPRI